MKKFVTYLWVALFAASLHNLHNSSFDWRQHSRLVTTNERPCCCDGEANAALCAKACCSNSGSEKEHKDCQGNCNNNSGNCTSSAITIVAMPNACTFSLSELIEYTFKSNIDGYTESIPKPITLPIWQPPKIS